MLFITLCLLNLWSRWLCVPTCSRPSRVLWMVTHLLGWAPLVVIAVMRESSSSFFSFSFFTRLSMARLANVSLSPPCLWHIRLCTMLRQASLLVGVLVIDILTSLSHCTFWEYIYMWFIQSGSLSRDYLHRTSAVVEEDVCPHKTPSIRKEGDKIWKKDNLQICDQTVWEVCWLKIIVVYEAVVCCAVNLFVCMKSCIAVVLVGVSKELATDQESQAVFYVLYIF